MNTPKLQHLSIGDFAACRETDGHWHVDSAALLDLEVDLGVEASYRTTCLQHHARIAWIDEDYLVLYQYREGLRPEVIAVSPLRGTWNYITDPEDNPMLWGKLGPEDGLNEVANAFANRRVMVRLE